MHDLDSYLASLVFPEIKFNNEQTCRFYFILLFNVFGRSRSQLEIVLGSGNLCVIKPRRTPYTF